MKVSRHGSARDHGPSLIELTNPHYLWDPRTGEVLLEYRDVKDFNTPAHHNWAVRIGADDVRLIVNAIAVAVSNGGAVDVVSSLSHSITSLLRIANACSEYRDSRASGEDKGIAQSK